MLPVNLQFRFQFQQIFAPKNMPAGIYQLHWYPTGSGGLGYELDLVGFGLGGLNRKQSTCLVSIAHSNVCICMWLPVCCCCCSALLTSLCKPFICPIIQPEAILFDTHIPQAPALLGHCALCVFSLCPVGCHTNSNTFMTHANFQLLPIPTGSYTPHPPLHTTHKRHTSPCSYCPHTIWKKWYPHPHCVCVLCETHCRHAPLNSFDAVIWQFLADFSLTFGFDQLI